MVTLCKLQQTRCKNSDRLPFDFDIIAILITCVSLLYVLVHNITLNFFREQNKQYAKAIIGAKPQLLEMP